LDAGSPSSPIHLQPLSIAERLDRAIRLYRNNFFTFVGMFAVFQIPVSVLSRLPSLLLISPGTANGLPSESIASGNRQLIGSCFTFIVAIANFILVSGIASAAIAQAAGASYLGQPIGISETYGKRRSSVGRLIGVRIASIFYIIGLTLWLIVPVAGWLTGIGILYFYSTAILTLVASRVVLERQGGVSAIRRAWDLTRRRRWPAVGFVGVLGILGQVLISGPIPLLSVRLGYLMQVPFGSNSSSGRAFATIVIQALVSLLPTLLLIPFTQIAVTRLYFDLRVRTEGSDMQIAAAEGEDVLEKAAEAPAAERGSLVTSNEMGSL
jgi:hypothetical protein